MGFLDSFRSWFQVKQTVSQIKKSDDPRLIEAANLYQSDNGLHEGDPPEQPEPWPGANQ